MMTGITPDGTIPGTISDLVTVLTIIGCITGTTPGGTMLIGIVRTGIHRTGTRTIGTHPTGMQISIILTTTDILIMDTTIGTTLPVVIPKTEIL